MTTETNFHEAQTWQINRLLVEAQRARAEAIADIVFAIGRGVARLFAPLVALGRQTAASLEHRREVDRLYRELSHMTDRDLADIGLSRGDICAVAEGTYRREAVPVTALRPVVRPEPAQLPRAA